MKKIILIYSLFLCIYSNSYSFKGKKGPAQDYSPIGEDLKKTSIRLEIPSDIKKPSLNLKDNDIFWYYKTVSPDSDKKRYMEYGENFYKVYPKQEEPILKNKKLVPKEYSPEDYPFFNPILFFEDKLSLGERERIKKSFILMKIILHSDKFLELMKDHKKKLSIKEYIDPIYTIDHIKKNPYLPLEDPEKIYNFLMKAQLYLYILKLSGDGIQTGTIADATVGNPTASKKISGIIRVYNYGKALNSYTYSLPMILFHEIFHVLGYPHLKDHHFQEYHKMINVKLSPLDIAYQIGTNVFYKLYQNFDFPKIDYSCYLGNSPRWNIC